MPRKYKKDSFLDLILDIVLMAGTLLIVYMALLYFTDRAKFWNWFIYGIIIMIAIIGFILLNKHFKKVKEKKKRLDCDRKRFMGIKYQKVEPSFVLSVSKDYGRTRN